MYQYALNALTMVNADRGKYIQKWSDLTLAVLIGTNTDHRQKGQTICSVYVVMAESQSLVSLLRLLFRQFFAQYQCKHLSQAGLKL